VYQADINFMDGVIMDEDKEGKEDRTEDVTDGAQGA